MCSTTVHLPWGVTCTGPEAQSFRYKAWRDTRVTRLQIGAASSRPLDRMKAVIGSWKPASAGIAAVPLAPAKRAEVPHHAIDLIEPTDACSAARFVTRG